MRQIFGQMFAQRFGQEEVEESADDCAPAENHHHNPRFLQDNKANELMDLIQRAAWGQCYKIYVRHLQTTGEKYLVKNSLQLFPDLTRVRFAKLLYIQ